MTRGTYLGSAQQRVMDALNEAADDGIDLRDLAEKVELTPRRAQQVVTALLARGLVRSRYRTGYNREAGIPEQATRVWAKPYFHRTARGPLV